MAEATLLTSHYVEFTSHEDKIIIVNVNCVEIRIACPQQQMGGTRTLSYYRFSDGQNV